MIAWLQPGLEQSLSRQSVRNITILGLTRPLFSITVVFLDRLSALALRNGYLENAELAGAPRLMEPKKFLKWRGRPSLFCGII